MINFRSQAVHVLGPSLSIGRLQLGKEVKGQAGRVRSCGDNGFRCGLGQVISDRDGRLGDRAVVVAPVVRVEGAYLVVSQLRRLARQAIGVGHNHELNIGPGLALEPGPGLPGQVHEGVGRVATGVVVQDQGPHWDAGAPAQVELEAGVPEGVDQVLDQLIAPGDGDDKDRVGQVVAVGLFQLVAFGPVGNVVQVGQGRTGLIDPDRHLELVVELGDPIVGIIPGNAQGTAQEADNGALGWVGTGRAVIVVGRVTPRLQGGGEING